MKTFLSSKKLIYSFVLLPLVFAFIPYQNNSIDKNLSSKYSSIVIPIDGEEGEYADYSIEEFATGSSHSGAIVTDDNTGSDYLYTWGINDRGQLGLGEEAKDKYSTPQRVTDLPDNYKNLSNLSMGYNHSAVVVDNKLFTWGDNSKGQLGIGKGTDTKYKTPQLVTALSRNDVIIDVSLGNQTSAISMDTDDKDELYTWGYNDITQLGQGYDDDDGLSNKYSPVLVNQMENSETPDTIQQISMGNKGGSAIMDNELYAWGRNQDGELGFEKNNSATYNHPRPDKVAFPSNAVGAVEQISMGNSAKSASGSAIVDNELYTWGLNNKGQLGLGEDKKDTNYYTPQLVTFFVGKGTVEQISMGDSHSAAVLNDNNGDHLYTWGNNTDWELGLNNDSKSPEFAPQEVTSLPKGDIKNISMGTNYSFAVVTDKNGDDYLYAWGDNSKGQLGIGDSEDKNVPQRVGPLHTPPDILFVQQWYFYLIIVIVVMFIIALISTFTILSIRKRKAIN